MIVPKPMFITARLEAGLKIDGVGTLSVNKVGNVNFAYRIEDAEGNELEYSEKGMRCPMADDYGEPMRTLLSFLSAAAESYRYTMTGHDSDNSDLFPPAVMEWAYMNESELQCAEMDLESEEA